MDSTTDNGTLILYRSQLIQDDCDVKNQEFISQEGSRKKKLDEVKSNIWYPSQLKQKNISQYIEHINTETDQLKLNSSISNLNQEGLFLKTDNYLSNRLDHNSTINSHKKKDRVEAILVNQFKKIFQKDSLFSEKISIHGVYRSEIVYILNQSLLKFNIANDSNFPCKFLVIDSDNLNKFHQFLKSLKLDENFIKHISIFKIHILVLADADIHNIDLENQASAKTPVAETLFKVGKDLRKNIERFGILIEYTDIFNNMEELYDYFRITNKYKIIGYFYCGRYQLKRREELLANSSEKYKYCNSKINIFGMDDSLNFLYNEIVEIENKSTENLSSQFIYKIFKQFNKNANNIVKLHKVLKPEEDLTADYINVYHSKGFQKKESSKFQDIENEVFLKNQENKEGDINLINNLGITQVNLNLDNYSNAVDFLDKKLIRENMINCMKYGFSFIEKRVKSDAKLFLIGSNSTQSNLRSLILSSIAFNYEPLNFLSKKEVLKEYIETQLNFKQSLDTKYQFIKLFASFDAFEHSFILACILAASKHSIPVILTDVTALTAAIFAFNLIKKSSMYIFVNEKILSDPLSNYLANKLNLRPIINSYDQLNKISASYLSMLIFSKIQQNTL